VPLAALTPVGDVGPALNDEHGGLARSFQAGLMYTCGLTSIGADDGDEEDMPIPMHGRLSSCPAEQVATTAEWVDGRYVIGVEGTVREATAFGTNLQLKRRVSAVLGENKFVIEDEVTNLSGSRPSPLMLAYHCNPGFPILNGAQSRIDFHSSRSVDKDAPDVAVAPSAWSGFLPPGSHEDESRVDRV
jgi:hypothetical protein